MGWKTFNDRLARVLLALIPLLWVQQSKNPAETSSATCTPRPRYCLWSASCSTSSGQGPARVRRGRR